MLHSDYKSILPEKLLISRNDVEEICNDYINHHVKSSISIQCISLITGFGLSYLATYIYSVSQGGNVSAKFLLLVMVSVALIDTLVLFLYLKNKAPKSDLRYTIYENVIKNSDHTAIFMISRNVSKIKEAKDIQLLTTRHSENTYFIVYEKLEDKRSFEIPELINNLANNLGIASTAISLKYEGSYKNIKRTSNDGDEKIILYDFFTVEISKDVEDTVNENDHYKWKSFDDLSKDVNTQIYNRDVIDYIKRNYYGKLNNSFVSKSSFLPIKVIWNITSKCPLNCNICATYDEQRKELELNKDEKARALLSLLSIGRNRIAGIDFSGGDPLLDDSSREIIKYAIQEIGTEKVSVTTTGEGINKVYQENKELFSLLRNWEITIETGDDKGTIRGAERYSFNNKYYISKIKDLVSNLIINVPIVNAQMSENEIKKLVERINKIEIHNKKITLIKLMKVGKNYNYDYSNYNPSGFIEKFQKYASSYDLDVKLQCALRTEYGAKGTKTDLRTCNMLKGKVGIDCAGNVFSCAWGGYINAYNEEISKNPFYLGNLLEEDLCDILKGKNAERITDKYCVESEHCCWVLKEADDKVVANPA